MHEHISKIPKILLEQMREVLKKKITITLYCPNCQGAKIKKNGKNVPQAELFVQELRTTVYRRPRFELQRLSQ
jgi:cytochrome c-type biogenesis protein CcmH/NrfF